MRETAETSGRRRPLDAGDVLLRLWQDLRRAVRDLGAKGGTPDAERRVHAVRVAARRWLVAASVLTRLGDPAEPDAFERLRRRVRSLRKKAGGVRDCDVHAALLRAAKDASEGGTAAARGGGPGVARAIELLQADRGVALAELESELKRRIWRERSGVSLRRLRQAARERVHLDVPGAVVAAILACFENMRRSAAADLSGPEALHTLRLAVKAARYTVSDLVVRFSASDDAAQARGVVERLAEAQQRLGEANDLETLVERLNVWLGLATSPSLTALRDRLALVRDHRAARAREWWGAHGTTGLTALGAMCSGSGAMAERSAMGSQGPEVRTMHPAAQNEAVPHLNGAGAAPSPDAQRDLWLSGQRLAVIDVGSNSIRLLVVELIDSRTWNVLGEERAMTRLAHGLAASASLCPEAMARSVEAIGRFRAIAERLSATTIRAYATAAVREAKNRQDFLSLVLDRTGLELELVSARDEGALTHRCVARVVDVSHGDAVVADLGGGSLEVVRSREGVVIENTSMRLGAVRLTEAFGGPDQSADARFDDLRAHIKEQIRRHVPTPDRPPAILVGCGGTFTTILTLVAASRGVMIERNSPALATMAPVQRSQVRDQLRRLREMPLAQRLRVPGLPSDRADIIVAGLAVIVRLMKRLGATELKVHPGGVREGLVLRLIERLRAETSPQGPSSQAVAVQGARAFAVRCRADVAHSGHVAVLALSLFDQLRAGGNILPGLGSRSDERLLLHVAAIVHDVGVLVGYRGHHRHGMTMLRHADLPSLSDVQREIVALLVRYHRKGEPRESHRAYAALPEAERAVVARLTAVLRVADGLDRRHHQSTLTVALAVSPKDLFIEAAAPEDAGEDLAGAAQKSGLLAGLTGRRVTVRRAASAPAAGQPLTPSPGLPA